MFNGEIKSLWSRKFSLSHHWSFLFCDSETALQDLKKDPKLKQEYREAKKLLNEVCLDFK